MKYVPTIGLEVHIQLATDSKIFCADRNQFGVEPNTNLSEISLAHPGTLPVLNEKAIELAIRMGLACQCEISQEMFFDRKNYFYPDLPKGYQLTQDKTPICVGGQISITNKSGEDKTITLTKIHLEEDAGKLIHNDANDCSEVDYNRAGVPLVELVTDPVIGSAEDASALLTEIRKIVRYLDISSGDMEKGSLRCDANVSVAREGSSTLGRKVEIKNMNSFKHVRQAINFEIERQVQLLSSGEEIISETRLYDVDTGKTYDMRTKEELNDYRYFPEPDLCPFVISDQRLREVRDSMPALPREMVARFTEQYGVSRDDALILSETRELALYFDELWGEVNDPKAAANWLIGPVRSLLKETGSAIGTLKISRVQLADMINLVSSNKLSFSKASAELLPYLVEHPELSAMQGAEHLNLLITNDGDDILPIIEEILNKHPEKVKAYQNGKKGLLGMFMGELMRETKGKIDPKAANGLIVKALEKVQ